MIARIITAAIMLGMLAVPAIASEKAMSVREIREIRDVAASFGDCVVKRNSSVARAVILNNADNDVILKRARTLVNGECLVKANHGASGGMRFRGDLFRYTMAGALVRSDYPQMATFDFGAVPPLAHNFPQPIDPAMRNKASLRAKNSVEQYDRDKAFADLSVFAECVVRASPAEVHALLLTDVASSEERAAFGKLAKPLSDCLGEGRSKFGLESLRGAIALGFYRLAGAPENVSIAALRVN